MRHQNQTTVREDRKSTRRRTATERFLDLFSEVEKARRKEM